MLMFIVGNFGYISFCDFEFKFFKQNRFVYINYCRKYISIQKFEGQNQWSLCFIYFDFVDMLLFFINYI